ncbi:peptide chain release factor 1-like, mitochondrial isoform X2 [Panulirus ornatus]|uniref:peptide chain release factor 1-like, mitochondrial isoform X2 n=1 Tax=Panulirus ornatus TaxID=150431 RepID=UPI003A878590
MMSYVIFNHVRGRNLVIHARILSRFCWDVHRFSNVRGPLTVSLRNMGHTKTFILGNYSLLTSKHESPFRTAISVACIGENTKKKEYYINRSFIYYPYSTNAYESLSVANVKVQEYLSALKSKYKNALNQVDDANVNTVKKLKPIMQLLEEMESTQTDINELHSLAKNSGDKEIEELAHLDLQEAQAKLRDLEEELFCCLVPEEPVDNNDVIVEVSAGVGGQEAMLFCQEIFEMYQSYADYMGWEVQITDYETTDIGGLRHGSIVFCGECVYSLLKYEGGIHRVQRVPKTERTGRIHTSTVSVAVMPQPSEIDIQILEKDLKIETKRAGGAGGQHVNTTDSAVRITHLPTGIYVESQKQRSQHQNKDECLKKLRALLYQQEVDRNVSQYTSYRKLQVGTRARSEKIRTYNYPQDRVTDHRIGVSLHNLPSFLGGADTLHSLICQLSEEARKETLYEIINRVEC